MRAAPTKLSIACSMFPHLVFGAPCLALHIHLLPAIDGTIAAVRQPRSMVVAKQPEDLQTSFQGSRGLQEIRHKCEEELQVQIFELAKPRMSVISEIYFAKLQDSCLYQGDGSRKIDSASV
jgi:hypothetical protein